MRRCTGSHSQVAVGHFCPPRAVLCEPGELVVAMIGCVRFCIAGVPSLRPPYPEAVVFSRSHLHLVLGIHRSAAARENAPR